MWKKSKKISTKDRPSSARPASANKHSSNRNRPSSAKPMYNRADQVKSNHSNPYLLPHPPPPSKHTTSPRPKVKQRSAYKNVKYQQKSWDAFTEHVWDQVNEQVNIEYGDSVRPEPMGADSPEEVTPTPASVDTSTSMKQQEDSTVSVGNMDDAGDPDTNEFVDSKLEINDMEKENKENGVKNNSDEGENNFSVGNDEDYIDVLPASSSNGLDKQVQNDDVSEDPDHRDEEKTIWDQIESQVQNEIQQMKLAEDRFSAKEVSESTYGNMSALNKEDREELKLNLGEEEDSDDLPTSIPSATLYEPPRQDKHTKHKSEKSVRFKDEVQTQEYVQNDDYDDLETEGEQDQNGFGVTNEQVALHPLELNRVEDNVTSQDLSVGDSSQNEASKEENSVELNEPKEIEEDLPPGYNPDDDSEEEW